MPGRMEFEFHFDQPERASSSRRGEDDPMRILLLGDFGGRALRGAEPQLEDRRVVPIDIDNFDDVLARLAPRAELPLGNQVGSGMPVEFGKLDDFHPDRLYEKLEIFQALRKTRKRLSDPSTFSEVAAELRRLEPPPEEGSPPDDSPGNAGDTAAENDASMFERLLGKEPLDLEAAQARGQQGMAREGIARLIQQMVAPYVVPAPDPQQADFIASVDQAISEQMRRLLHHSNFQALESAWRAVHWLVTNLETDETLKLYLLDVSKQELAADFRSAGDDLTSSGLYRLLVEKGVRIPGGQPWSLLVGNFTFGTETGDEMLLASLGATASQAGGPLVAAADPVRVGCPSLVESPDPRDWHVEETDEARRWQGLRQSSVASWIGLAMPRILLRLPYGRQSDEIERFDFEELPPGRDHGSYLWGNPAFGCALLIGSAFTERGWSMEPGDLLDLADLPASLFDDDGERRMKPCAEVCLGERAGDAILRSGIMPLLSYRDRNAVRVLRFQSLADPPAPLSGPWE